jgi:hypothetical protein
MSFSDTKLPWSHQCNRLFSKAYTPFAIAEANGLTDQFARQNGLFDKM